MLQVTSRRICTAFVILLAIMPIGLMVVCASESLAVTIDHDDSTDHHHACAHDGSSPSCFLADLLQLRYTSSLESLALLEERFWVNNLLFNLTPFVPPRSSLIIVDYQAIVIARLSIMLV